MPARGIRRDEDHRQGLVTRELGRGKSGVFIANGLVL